MIGHLRRSGRSRRCSGLLLLGVLVVLLGCGPPSVRDEGKSTDPAYLLDADGAGAIAWEPTTRTYVGLRHDGSVAWRDHDQSDDPLDIRCAGQCPTAVVANLATGTGRWISAEQSGPWVEGTPLWSGGENGDHILYRLDGQGVARLSMPSASVPVQAGKPFFALNVDATSGLVIVPGSSERATELIRLKRDAAQAWTVLERREIPAAGSACIAENGEAYAVTSQAGVTLSGLGTEKVFDYPHAGWCALSQDRVITARFASKAGADSTELAVWGVDGKIRWQRSFPALARIKVRGALVVVARPGRHELLRLTDGTPLPAPGLAGAHDALFVSDTELATVRLGEHRGLVLQRVQVQQPH